DLDGVAQLQRLPEDPGEPVARSHQPSDLPCSVRISLTTLSLRFELREAGGRSRAYARNAPNVPGRPARRRLPVPAPSAPASAPRRPGVRRAAPPGPAGRPPAPASGHPSNPAA